MRSSNSNIQIFSAVTAFLLLVACTSTGIAHNVKGIQYPTLATARITSPTTSADMPIPIFNTGVSVACFNVRNSSPYPWTVITAVGLDLPGDNGDFNLVLPSGSSFHVDSHVDMDPLIPGRALDFAFLTGPRFNSDGGKGGLRPSTDFTPMCASGEFPVGMSIETMLDYVFVRFTRVGPEGNFSDVGIWENAPLP